MNISKKDTIIIAVLVNVALLAVLFVTAVRDKPVDSTFNATQANAPLSHEETTVATKAKDEKSPSDEIDTVLQEYALKQKVITLQELNKEVQATDGAKTVITATKNSDEESEEPKESIKPKKSEKLGTKSKITVKKAEVAKKSAADEDVSDPDYYIVKSGDNPWKIAKKFHVKYEDLLALNGLNEEKAKNLKIGQKIRIK